MADRGPQLELYIRADQERRSWSAPIFRQRFVPKPLLSEIRAAGALNVRTALLLRDLLRSPLKDLPEAAQHQDG